jgi:hypothetical protein
VESSSLSVRLYGGADLGVLPVDAVVSRLVAANASKVAFQAEA